MIEAEIDLRGAFELDLIRAGLSKATVVVAVRADVDDAALAELAEGTQRSSGVYNSLAIRWLCNWRSSASRYKRADLGRTTRASRCFLRAGPAMVTQVSARLDM